MLALFWMWHANNSEHENGYNRVTDKVLWSIEQSTISSAQRKERSDLTPPLLMYSKIEILSAEYFFFQTNISPLNCK